MVKDIYEKWLNHPNLDPSYKEVLEQMDEGQIQRCVLYNHRIWYSGDERSVGTWYKPY